MERLEKGDTSLPEFITKTTLLVDSCTYPSQARDRILSDAIMLGIKSEKAYYKLYVAKGSDLTLAEVLEIVQSVDSTQHQVEASRQQTEIRTETDVHKFQSKQSPWKRGAKQKKQGQPKQQSQDQGVCHSKKAKQLHEMQTALNRLQNQQPA